MTVARQPEGARHMCSSYHGVWDRSLESALEVEDGDVVELHVPDASRDQIGEHAVVADLESIDFDLMNPVAGPVFVRGAQPGDVRPLAPLVFSWLARRGARATRLDPHDAASARELQGRLMRVLEDARLFADRIVVLRSGFRSTSKRP